MGRIELVQCQKATPIPLDAGRVESALHVQDMPLPHSLTGAIRRHLVMLTTATNLLRFMDPPLQKSRE